MTPIEFGDPMRTERLVLRMLVEDDLDDVVRYQGDSEVCRYLLYEAQTREQVAERIARHSKATRIAEQGDYWQIAVVLPGEDGERGRVIGDVYFTLKSTENSGGEIGWAFARDVHGHGYAKEAASAVLGRAFGEFGLHRVMAEIDPRNHASARLCLALGMREEAHFVKDMMFRGEWADTGMYAILEEEWNPR